MEQLLKDLKLVINVCSSGTGLLAFLPSLGGNWVLIAKAIEEGLMFSEAIEKHPFPELTEYESKILIALTHAGEMGGVLETTLQRFIVFAERTEKDPIIEYLRTLGTFLHCGIPVLQSIRSCPATSAIVAELQSVLHESIKLGNSFSECLGKFVTPENNAKIHEGEHTGALSEHLMSLK